MIVGAGNDRPTPRIVLDILGVDQTNDPDPLMYKAIAEGSKQLNYGKVWSGLYEIEGRTFPSLFSPFF
jgi:chitin synthase